MAEHIDDHNEGGMKIFLFGMIASVVFFTYIIFVHKHPSPDTVRNLPGASVPAEQTK